MTGVHPGEINYRLLLYLSGAGVLMLVVLSLHVGLTSLPVLATLVDGLQGHRDTAWTVLMELRLPRALLGVLVGASLGVAGAAMQGLLRNPLAEPGIVGVSGCAALGAVIAFYSGLTAALPMALPVAGIVGALGAVFILYLLAGRAANTLTLILAGVAINAFAGALTALALNLSSSPYAFLEIIFWQMGSLADRSMAHVALCLPLMAVGFVMLLASGRGLDVLTLGEDTAVSLGIDLARLRLQVIVGTALAVGSAVAVSGVIGFVGLVVPHLLRPFVGFQPGRLLGASALGGAVLVLLADVGVRLLPTDNELKLGVVTALIGGPFFLWLIRKLRGETY